MIPVLKSIKDGYVIPGDSMAAKCNHHLKHARFAFLRLTVEEQKLPVAPDVEECPACDGSGDTKSKKDCPVCNGWGVVQSKCPSLCEKCGRSECLKDEAVVRFLRAEIGKTQDGPWKSVGCSPKPAIARFLAQVRAEYGLQNPESS